MQIEQSSNIRVTLLGILFRGSVLFEMMHLRVELFESTTQIERAGVLVKVNIFEETDIVKVLRRNDEKNLVMGVKRV